MKKISFYNPLVGKTDREIGWLFLVGGFIAIVLVVSATAMASVPPPPSLPAPTAGRDVKWWWVLGPIFMIGLGPLSLAFPSIRVGQRGTRAARREKERDPERVQSNKMPSTLIIVLVAVMALLGGAAWGMWRLFDAASQVVPGELGPVAIARIAIGFSIFLWQAVRMFLTLASASNEKRTPTGLLGWPLLWLLASSAILTLAPLRVEWGPMLVWGVVVGVINYFLVTPTFSLDTSYWKGPKKTTLHDDGAIAANLKGYGILYSVTLGFAVAFSLYILVG